MCVAKVLICSRTVNNVSVEAIEGVELSISFFTLREAKNNSPSLLSDLNNIP